MHSAPGMHKLLYSPALALHANQPLLLISPKMILTDKQKICQEKTPSQEDLIQVVRKPKTVTWITTTGLFDL